MSAPRALLTVRRAAGRAAIGVESAVLSAGLPAPSRAEAVTRVRAAAEREGAEACFVGVIAGRPVVGCTAAELERLMGPGAEKASTRDLPSAIVRGADAGTTVAATLALARRARLRVIVTGGIGGVHPGQRGLDVSADLIELARTPAIVVCSGPKAFLDLRATLERLETLGVPLVGFGTRECPGFWSRSSGLRLPDAADSAPEVVARWRAWRRLGGRAALVVCVPSPEAFALDAETSASLVARASAELRSRDLSAAAVTPFVLERIAEWSEGRSVRANLALLEENARVGARIALELEEVTG